MPAPVFRRFERAFGWHLLITAEARAHEGRRRRAGQARRTARRRPREQGQRRTRDRRQPGGRPASRTRASHRYRSRGCRTSSRANAERLSATTELEAAAACDVTILLVPTPSDERGAFTNAFLLDAIERVGRALGERDDYHVVVVASTVMPGSCEGELAPRAGAGLRTQSRRLAGALLQPGVHRARERDPGHARAGHGPDRRVRRARRRHARGALRGASARTIRRSGA